MLAVDLDWARAARRAPEPAVPRAPGAPAGLPLHRRLLQRIEGQGSDPLAPAFARVVRIAQDASKNLAGSAAEVGADVLAAVAGELGERPDRPCASS